MAEGPRKTSAQDEADGSVLAGLPATRPNRMGRRSRDGGGATATRPKPAAKATAKRAAKATAKAKPAAKPKATAKPKPKPAAKAKAAAAPVEEPTPIREPRKPRPVRAGHPGLDSGADRERPADQDAVGLAGAVVSAAGDVAGVGVKLGGRVLKGIAGRLSK